MSDHEEKNQVLKKLFSKLKIDEQYIVQKQDNSRKQVTSVDDYFSKEFSVEIYPTNLILQEFLNLISLSLQLENFYFDKLYINSLKIQNDKEFTFILILREKKHTQAFKTAITIDEISFPAINLLFKSEIKPTRVSMKLKVEEGGFTKIFRIIEDDWYFYDAIIKKSDVSVFDSLDDVFKSSPKIKKPKFFDVISLVDSKANVIFGSDNFFETKSIEFDCGFYFQWNNEIFIFDGKMKLTENTSEYTMNFINKRHREEKIELFEKENTYVTTHKNIIYSRNIKMFEDELNSQIDKFEKEIPRPLFSRNERILSYTIYYDKNYEIKSMKLREYSIILRENLRLNFEHMGDGIRQTILTHENMVLYLLNNKYQSSSVNLSIFFDVEKIRKYNSQLSKKVLYICENIHINDVKLNFESNFLSLYGSYKNADCLIRVPLHRRDTFEFFINNLLNSIFDIPVFEKDLKIPMNSKSDINFFW
eukprot:gene5689-9510_t